MTVTLPGTSATALLDSGASRNLIAFRTYLTLEPLPVLTPHPLFMRGFNGKITASRGMITIPVGLVDTQRNHTYTRDVELHVMDEMHDELLLSLDGMEHGVESLDTRTRAPRWRSANQPAAVPDGMQQITTAEAVQGDFHRPSSW